MTSDAVFVNFQHLVVSGAITNVSMPAWASLYKAITIHRFTHVPKNKSVPCPVSLILLRAFILLIHCKVFTCMEKSYGTERMEEVPLVWGL
jgi:hypothetical protein